jgi:hypothetical protein
VGFGKNGLADPLCALLAPETNVGVFAARSQEGTLGIPGAIPDPTKVAFQSRYLGDLHNSNEGKGA